MIKEDMKYVSWIVSQYLRTKPELETFRDDLVQEGTLALYEAKAKYDPKYGHDENLYVYYQVGFALSNYIRNKEAKHFRSVKPVKDVKGSSRDTSYSVQNEIDKTSARWDLDNAIQVEQLPSKDDRNLLDDRLLSLLKKVTLTVTQERALHYYLQDLNYAEIGRHMGISRQRAGVLINQVIVKVQLIVE